MIPSQPVDVTSERRKESTSECSSATCHNRIDHAEPVRIQVAEAGKVEIVIEKPDLMMFSNRTKECLVAFVRGNVKDFPGFPELLRIFVPLLCGNLYLFILQIPATNVQGGESTTTFIVERESSVFRLEL